MEENTVDKEAKQLFEKYGLDSIEMTKIEEDLKITVLLQRLETSE